MGRHGLGLIAILTLATVLLSGCRYYLGPTQRGEAEGKGSGETVEEDEAEAGKLTVLVEATHDAPYYAADVLTITWSANSTPTVVSIDLYRGEEPVLVLAAKHSELSYLWTIPEGLEPSEIYRIRVAEQSGDKQEGPSGFSRAFAIDRSPETGLSDVTVTRREIALTVTDNGSLVDGDTVHIRLNGITVAAEHVLVGPPGTEIPVTLVGGANVLEITAVNEGSVGPNTAQLSISDVSQGEPVQEWRLSVGQTGSMTIRAP